jgi:hypothetical protein
MTNQQDIITTKSITFKSTVIVRDTVRIDDYTAEEIKACFYCKADYREFKLDNRRTARMIKTKQKIDEMEFSVRGVEHLTTETYKIRRGHRRTAVVAVLQGGQMQQFICYEEDDEGLALDHDEKIAAAYTDAVRDSVVSAYIVGLSDEMVAREQKNPEGDRRRVHVVSPVLKVRSREPRFCRVRRHVFNAAA